jgi:tetratricopeptide (TPR) repeat protein
MKARFSRLSWTVAACLVVLLGASGAALAQDWRGAGHLAGTVTDDNGQPVEGVVVKAQRVGSTGGTQAKTNKKGEWLLNGINGGEWNLDFELKGYDTSRITAHVDEHSPNPPVITKLKKAAADPNIALQADLKKATDLMNAQKYADARAIYQDVLAKHPDAAKQLEPYIARTYYGEHNLDAAIEHLRTALAADPDNVDVKMLLANTLAEKGDAQESQQIVASIDETKITRPEILLNVGIGMLNAKKPEEALTWFEKTATRFPDYASAYYYRGITELQLGKNDQAKADLTKFVGMAPDAPEAATAKGILEKMK